MSRRMLLWVVLSAGATWGLAAQDQGATPRIQVSVSPAAEAAATRETAWLEALLELPQGMHQTLQEKYFGLVVQDNGLPPGWTAGQTVYPPTTQTVAGVPSYEGSVLIRLPLTARGSAAGGFTLRAAALWQLCYDDGVCLVPASKVFELPVRLVPGQGYRSDVVRIVDLSQGTAGGLGFGAPAPASVLLPDPAPTATGPTVGGLLSLLLLALAGGALLNLMPCVLPVLSIKALSLIKQVGGDRRQRWLHALAATAGIIVSLLAMAMVSIGLRSAGVAVGWGIQFQNPWYVTGLATLVLVFALSLFDVFLVTGPSLTQGRSQGIGGSFLSGLLTVVLATPCTAPFLGTALGLALSSPAPVILAVFLAIGVGLALPFALVTVIPGALERLPRPGKWLDVFRGLMAFALVGTVIWLLTVLQRQVDRDAFARVLWFLGAVGVAAWLYGLLQRSDLRTIPRAVTRAGLAVFLVGSALLLLRFPAQARDEAAQSAPTLPPGWSPFAEEDIQARLAQGSPVLVDFTAQWCLTCRVNEAGALSDAAVLAGFRDRGVALVRGDYTNPDPVISAWLRRYGKAGVPFYALLVPGSEAILLPEILTREQLLRVLSSLPVVGVVST